MKYIPDEMLSDEQFQGKTNAVKREWLRLDDMRYEYAAKKNIPKDKKILDTVKQLGGKNIKNKNVTFVFDEKGTGSILLHARSAELQAAALAAPYFAKYGGLIAGQKNHESTGLATLTFAAPVIINGDTVNVGVSVQFQSNGKPKAVNVELQSGGKFVFDAKKYLLDLIAVLNDMFKGRRYPQQVLIKVYHKQCRKSSIPTEIFPTHPIKIRQSARARRSRTHTSRLWTISRRSAGLKA